MGTACIFIYVGAEVAIGSLLTNYLLSLHITHGQARAAIGPWRNNWTSRPAAWA